MNPIGVFVISSSLPLNILKKFMAVNSVLDQMETRVHFDLLYTKDTQH